MEQNRELFLQIDEHFMRDDKPSIYLESFINSRYSLDYPFDMVKNLKKANQSPVHHPEGNVWNHTLLVVDAAAQVKMKSSDPEAFMWAAFLHDIGKPDTTKVLNGKITSYNHDKLGAKLAKQFLEQLRCEPVFIDKVSALVRWHMQILFVVKGLPFADIKHMKEQTSVSDVALLGYCDRLGRLHVDRQTEEENIRQFLKLCGKNTFCW